MEIRISNKWLEKVKELLKRRRNRYLLVLAAFVIWITFFDHNNLIRQVKYLHNLHELRGQKAYLEEEIEKTQKQLTRLSNPAELEKFAREEYLMRKEGEDVFIVKEK